MKLTNLLLGVLFLGSLAARADVQFEQQATPCKKAHEEFCPSEKARTKGLTECLAKHKDELSPECKAEVEKYQAKIASMKDAKKKAQEACRDDFFKVCQGVPMEEPTRTACLKRHMSKLSEACAKTLE